MLNLYLRELFRDDGIFQDPEGTWSPEDGDAWTLAEAAIPYYGAIKVVLFVDGEDAPKYSVQQVVGDPFGVHHTVLYETPVWNVRLQSLLSQITGGADAYPYIEGADY
jgi:hypothetical protein